MKNILILLIVCLISFESLSQIVFNTYEALKKNANSIDNLYGSFYGYSFKNENEGYVGYDDTLYQTLDGGNNWKFYTLITLKNLPNIKRFGLFTISFVNDSVWYANTTKTNTIVYLLKSTDYGKTWNRVVNLQSIKSYKEINHSSFYSDKEQFDKYDPISKDIQFYPENYKHDIVHFIWNDGSFSNWDCVLLLRDFRVTSINFISENVGYIGGCYNQYIQVDSSFTLTNKIPIIAKTVDGGKSWELLTYHIDYNIIRNTPSIVTNIKADSNGLVQLDLEHSARYYTFKSIDGGKTFQTIYKNPGLK
jgi:hypothetical protein